MSQDKLMFRSLLVRIPSSSTTTAGMVNMFSSLEMVRSLFIALIYIIILGEESKSKVIQENGICNFKWRKRTIWQFSSGNARLFQQH